MHCCPGHPLPMTDPSMTNLHLCSWHRPCFFLFLLLLWQGCADVARDTTVLLMFAPVVIIWQLSACGNQRHLSWKKPGGLGPGVLVWLLKDHLALLCSFNWCDGYLSRAENREPQQALGAESEQILQSKIPGLCLGHVRESLLAQVSLSEISLWLLQNVLLFRCLIYLHFLLIIT